MNTGERANKSKLWESDKWDDSASMQTTDVCNEGERWSSAELKSRDNTTIAIVLGSRV